MLANGNEVPGLRHIGPIAAEIVADLRFRHHVERLHRFGPRVASELLAEVGAEHGIRTIVDQKLARFAELDPETVAATGGDEFSPALIHEVPK